MKKSTTKSTTRTITTKAKSGKRPSKAVLVEALTKLEYQRQDKEYKKACGEYERIKDELKGALLEALKDEVAKNPLNLELFRLRWGWAGATLEFIPSMVGYSKRLEKAFKAYDSFHSPMPPNYTQIRREVRERVYSVDSASLQADALLSNAEARLSLEALREKLFQTKRPKAQRAQSRLREALREKLFQTKQEAIEAEKV